MSTDTSRRLERVELPASSPVLAALTRNSFNWTLTRPARPARRHTKQTFIGGRGIRVQQRSIRTGHCKEKGRRRARKTERAHEKRWTALIPCRPPSAEITSLSKSPRCRDNWANIVISGRTVKKTEGDRRTGGRWGFFSSEWHMNNYVSPKEVIPFLTFVSRTAVNFLRQAENSRCIVYLINKN